MVRPSYSILYSEYGQAGFLKLFKVWALLMTFAKRLGARFQKLPQLFGPGFLTSCHRKVTSSIWSGLFFSENWSKMSQQLVLLLFPIDPSSVRLIVFAIVFTGICPPVVSCLLQLFTPAWANCRIAQRHLAATSQTHSTVHHLLFFTDIVEVCIY